MAQLDKDRATVEIEHQLGKLRAASPGAHTFYAGGMVMRGRDDGLVKPASGSKAAIGCGMTVERATYTVAGSGSFGPTQHEFRSGVFAWDNSTSSDEIKNDDVGKLAWIVDDHTVALTSNSDARAIAGRIHSVDGSKVFVHMDDVLIPSGSTL